MIHIAAGVPRTSSQPLDSHVPPGKQIVGLKSQPQGARVTFLSRVVVPSTTRATPTAPPR